MKTVTIYYDVKEGNGQIGETCTDLTLADYNFDILLSVGTGRETATYAHVERILTSMEILKGRLYVQNSIKCIKEL